MAKLGVASLLGLAGFQFVHKYCDCGDDFAKKKKNLVIIAASTFNKFHSASNIGPFYMISVVCKY